MDVKRRRWSAPQFVPGSMRQTGIERVWVRDLLFSTLALTLCPVTRDCQCPAISLPRDWIAAVFCW